MNVLLNQMNELRKKEKVEDNLFVKNIIVNKDKANKEVLPYIDGLNSIQGKYP